MPGRLARRGGPAAGRRRAARRPRPGRRRGRAAAGTAGHGGDDVARVLQPQVGAARGRRPGVRSTVASPCGSSSARRNVVPSYASTPGTALGREQVEQPPPVERLPGGQPQHHRAGDGGGAAGGGLVAQVAGRGGEDRAHRVVELPDAGEARPRRRPRTSRRSVVSTRMRAVCARWARASAWAPAPDLGDQQPVQLPLAVAEPGGEPGDALAVDRAVADQPHRPGDRVGRGRSTPASRGRRPAGSGGRPGSRPAGRPPRSGRSRRCAASAWSPGSSAGSRCRSS